MCWVRAQIFEMSWLCSLEVAQGLKDLWLVPLGGALAGQFGGDSGFQNLAGLFGGSPCFQKSLAGPLEGNPDFSKKLCSLGIWCLIANGFSDC